MDAPQSHPGVLLLRLNLLLSKETVQLTTQFCGHLLHPRIYGLMASLLNQLPSSPQDCQLLTTAYYVVAIPNIPNPPTCSSLSTPADKLILSVLHNSFSLYSPLLLLHHFLRELWSSVTVIRSKDTKTYNKSTLARHLSADLRSLVLIFYSRHKLY